MKRLKPETRLRNRVLRLLARMARLTAREVAWHLARHADGDGYACPKRCRVAAVGRERERLAALLVKGHQ